jgi:hypothetical protein
MQKYPVKMMDFCFCGKFPDIEAYAEAFGQALVNQQKYGEPFPESTL